MDRRTNLSASSAKPETREVGPSPDTPDLDEEACYRVFAARDRRFEGRLVMAVRTTGVYCRPGCPARTPLRKNVRFFPGPAAAEEAGFRPCLRCRPDAAPGSPATAGTGATVARALRLLATEGAPAELGDRLGVGERHLRRLFARHLGASPARVARSLRDHFARRLLEETELPLADVALAAGFSGPDRCAAALRGTFGLGPRELRRRGASRRLDTPSGHIALRLPYRTPFDWAGLLGFLGPRAIPGVERVEGDTWARTVRAPSGPAVLRVRPLPGESALVLEVPALPAGAPLLATVDRVRRLFDLDADPHAIGAHLERDPLLAPLVARRPGLRVPGAWDPFETAVRAILGQQISVAGATTLAGRIAASHGEPIEAAPGFTRLFPTPAALASLDESGAGLPAARVRAIRAVAAAVLSGAVDFSADRSAVAASLLALAGIGPWTVGYLGMRALGDPDAFPSGDLGLRQALAAGGSLPSAAQVETRAGPWRPYRAYATMHLWVSLADLPRPSRRSSR